MIKKILILLLVALVAIQFFRPDKNDSNDETYGVATKYTVGEELTHLMQVSCNDCHSNKTEYPWYANVQPVAWWLDKHVENGKRHLNFSTFTKLPIAVQNHKFEEIIEMVADNEMPLPAYTNLGLHKEANLNEKERNLIVNWVKDQMAMLKATYPSDSLVMKRRRPAN
jgi:hypothetical protein